MAKIINFKNNDLAFACDCGCATFNLVDNGIIECSGCGHTHEKLFWDVEGAESELTAYRGALKRILDIKTGNCQKYVAKADAIASEILAKYER